MKKWLLICFILFFPMGLYAVMSNNHQDNAAFESQIVHAQGKPCVYKFASTMCKDCIELEKILNTLTPEYSDKINFVYYNVDKNDKKVKAMIKKYGLTVVPSMIFVDENGNEKLKIEGLVSREELEKQLKALINE